ncbi:hypothetical protein EVAR_49518_1 [Eumeta japonica]|uniref:Uncharacterized protein n=1 Tax=Eumeta variegata TaxID=151549 RepID=A0A4C1XML9_EUMVA|nr:hypothetical protein EVAR_49518_1 [Eumeta japonica]
MSRLPQSGARRLWRGYLTCIMIRSICSSMRGLVPLGDNNALINTCNPRGVTNALSASFVEIGYMMERELMKGKWSSGTLAYWTKRKQQSLLLHSNDTHKHSPGASPKHSDLGKTPGKMSLQTHYSVYDMEAACSAWTARAILAKLSFAL